MQRANTLLVVTVALSGCFHPKPLVIDPDDGHTVLEESAGENDPLVVAAIQANIGAIAIVDHAGGYRPQRAILRTPNDTVEHAIVRFMIGAARRGARAVTDLVVHETDRELRCVTRVFELPELGQLSVAGRLVATQQTALVLDEERDHEGRWWPLLGLERRTSLHREPSQVVVRLVPASHRDRTCTTSDQLDPNGGLWVAGTLLH